MISLLLPFSLSFSGSIFLRCSFRARLRRKTRSQPWFPSFSSSRFPFCLVGCGVLEVGVFVGVVLTPITGVTIAVFGCNTHRRIGERSLAGRTPRCAHWGREPSRAVPYETLFGPDGGIAKVGHDVPCGCAVSGGGVFGVGRWLTMWPIKREIALFQEKKGGVRL